MSEQTPEPLPYATPKKRSVLVIGRFGAVVSGMEFWSRRGWVRPPDDGSPTAPSRGLNLRREKLDPIIRRAAACTPGVDLLLGHTARRLLRRGSRVTGVVVEGRDGELRELTAPLTVGADGRDSRIALPRKSIVLVLVVVLVLDPFTFSITRTTTRTRTRLNSEDCQTLGVPDNHELGARQ